MDPDEALTQIREGADYTLRRSNSPDIRDFAHTVLGLDDWMSRGGFAPTDWRPKIGRPIDTEPGDVLDDVEHGTFKGYRAGCRCLECKAANREAVAKYRAQRNGNGS